MIIPVRRHSECRHVGSDLRDSLRMSGPTMVARRTPLTRIERARVCSNWSTCFLIGALTFVQFTVAFRALDKKIFSSYGRDPDLGMFNTGKTNDVPFIDRVLACVQNDDGYKPALMSDLVGLAKTIDTSGTSISGYRLLEDRRTRLQLDSTALTTYSRVCNVASKSMSFLAFACSALGYHTVADGLRVVLGVESNNTLILSSALPLLIMPVWDNAPIARYALPGSDGSACILRLSGAFADKRSPVAVAYGMDRSVVEKNTVGWVSQPGGKWQNGWYDDSVSRWHSFVETTKKWRSLPRARYFESHGLSELDCTTSSLCKEQSELFQWGQQFSVQTTDEDSTSIIILNGTQFGVFWSEGATITSIHSTYNWQTALSNSSVALLVFRWAVALFALRRGFHRGHSNRYHAGVGVLSNCISFQYFPIFALPRLTMTLTAFCSIGCNFQGEQLALAETWYVMYPAIAELMLFYYSLLNSLAKITRRRVTDSLFGPTAILFIVLHIFRHEVSQTQWFGTPDGQFPTLITSQEMTALTLGHFFASDIALRLNGGAVNLLILKMSILGVSFVSLCLAKPLPTQTRFSLSGIEKALAIRASNVAGLGRSRIYETQSSRDARSDRVQPSSRLTLTSYELLRLGYVVFGDRYVISVDDWDRVSMLAGFHHFYHLWNHRVEVLEFRSSRVASSSSISIEVSNGVKLMRVDAPELQRILPWHISARTLLC